MKQLLIESPILFTPSSQNNQANSSAEGIHITQEQATQYIDDSRRELYDIVRYHERLIGQDMKHRLRSAPPTMMPASVREPNW